ncbi:L-histidine N(alpha)-methyltransferase [Neopusillimonas maritima]|uniref:L-histidine N(Alpha)-methyltransferase n=1 Tax=Neopusillimonas maritima TaxID=2026239 RepID=A0A3A1YT06_9BURK|nr:L-histidine N(alpha)-methyltransferase [Neopusillimonas maritima]RIY39534.1 L-histidine N(alpha)-methyltransferase [Neopusillimonas maritima]
MSVQHSEKSSQEIISGLTADPPHISPKYLYDELGSRLFTAITELPEYYPTRTEAQILKRHSTEIKQAIGATSTLIDLGAGDGEKATALFEPFQIKRYVAVDISAAFLQTALARLQSRYPHIEMVAVAQDFSHSLHLPAETGNDPRLFFYPGSSIGNFNPADALAFLQRVRAACPNGRLLIGVDLVKPADILERAYDDALQVTAAFNRNILRHINQLAQTNFNLHEWRHVALFNADESRIEMHLEATRGTTVTWPNGQRQFVAGERIHTENSYKWQTDAFAALLKQAGFKDCRHWSDDKNWFAVFVAQA